MNPVRRTARVMFGYLSSVVLICSAGSRAETGDTQDPPAIPIWKTAAPDSDAKHWPRPDYHEEWETPGEVLRGVTQPTIQVFLPDPKLNTGAAVVICPGGGYRNLYVATSYGLR